MIIDIDEQWKSTMEFNKLSKLNVYINLIVWELINTTFEKF